MRYELTQEQLDELTKFAMEAEKEHERRRAKALLMYANGKTFEEVAKALRVQSRQTVARWMHRYLEEGVQGLKIKPGRGRKPKMKA